LPNRRALDEYLAGLHRTGGDAATVILIDIDDYKSVNDQCGHQVGDAVLREVAGRLSGLAGDGVMVARLGGDEFVIVVGDLPVMRIVGTAARAVSECEVMTPSGVHRLRASIGTARWSDGDTAADVLARADAAMYHAKRNRPHPAIRSAPHSHTPRGQSDATGWQTASQPD
jgi:diguanylate cyclase (GGDEF)-like protein